MERKVYISWKLVEAFVIRSTCETVQIPIIIKIQGTLELHPWIELSLRHIAVSYTAQNMMCSHVIVDYLRINLLQFWTHVENSSPIFIGKGA
jgi:hypothetical protein